MTWWRNDQTIQTHMFNMTNWWCKQPSWLIIHDQDDACTTMNVTPCVSATNSFMENATNTHEEKTLSITRTWSQAWLRHQHAKTWMQWTSKVDVRTHASSRSEPECVQSSSETLKGGSEIGCRPKFWRVVVAATTLGDTLVELQLQCFGSLLSEGLGISGSIESLRELIQLLDLPHGHTWFTFC